MIIENGYLVLRCGCTDCFPQGIFFSEEEANEYGKLNATNPEGYVIQKICVRSLALQYD
jgi:hypothetical protein